MNRNAWIFPVALVAGLAVSSVGFAQVPAGATGECKDGTYTSVEKKRGACAGHGGVKDWYATSKKAEAKAGKSADAKSAKAGATPSGTSVAATAAPPAATTAMASKKAPKGMRAEAAPGGGAGKVWLNTSTKVYHCSGDEWYGKTKAGEYVSEADAKAKGAHAAHGKACS